MHILLGYKLIQNTAWLVRKFPHISWWTAQLIEPKCDEHIHFEPP